MQSANYNYEELLKKGRSSLPQQAQESKRLEIPELKSLVVGNRTKVTNLVEISKVVRRDLNHIIKFLTKEVASQAVIEPDGVMFNGKIGNILLNNKFREYLKEFVFCHECSKPDTNLHKEARVTIMKCEACGARKTVATLKQ